MANTNLAFGFRPVRYLNGTPWNGKFRIYYVGTASTVPILPGDPVIYATSLTATTYSDPLGYYSPILPGANGSSYNVGIAVAFGPVQSGSNGVALFKPTDLYTNYRPASTAYYVGVVDDPNVIFQVQDDGSATLTAASLTLNADYATIANASIGTAVSTASIVASTVATTATLPFRILGLASNMDTIGGNTNALTATSVYNVWEVCINQNVYKAGQLSHS